jgi:hypothetical protein
MGLSESICTKCERRCTYITARIIGIDRGSIEGDHAEMILVYPTEEEEEEEEEAARNTASENTAPCTLCGEPMPVGEEMFQFHGYSGNCTKPPLPNLSKPSEPTPAWEAEFNKQFPYPFGAQAPGVKAFIASVEREAEERGQASAAERISYYHDVKDAEMVQEARAERTKEIVEMVKGMHISQTRDDILARLTSPEE